MTIIAIGDIHGRTYWKQIISKAKFDKVVFIGDYFDAYKDITPEQQKSNFEDIIKFKKEYLDKVVLLFGNHDYHYLKTVEETYSGFQRWYKTDIAEMLHKAIDEELIQMCYIYNKYLFSHAGVTKTWLKNTGYIDDQLDLYINDLFKYKPLAFKFTKGENQSSYGDDICQSPIWVRPNSLHNDCLDDYVQIVGHTAQHEIKIIEDKIALIDTLGTSGEFLCIKDEKMLIQRLKGQTLFTKCLACNGVGITCKRNMNFDFYTEFLKDIPITVYKDDYYSDDVNKECWRVTLPSNYENYLPSKYSDIEFEDAGFHFIYEHLFKTALFDYCVFTNKKEAIKCAKYVNKTHLKNKAKIWILD